MEAMGEAENESTGALQAGGNGLEGPEQPARRRFLASASAVAMAGGLAAGYGAFAGIAGRFLYPSRPSRTRWHFVLRLAEVRRGQAVRFVTPEGRRMTVARRAENGTADDFTALSSVCPHLGCQVHWQPREERFLCPCHNGVFDSTGRAIAGPPADAGQSLSQYPLAVEDGLLFVGVPEVL
jgi:cytochrome b6-f complex iron-sulfur subunit